MYLSIFYADQYNIHASTYDTMHEMTETYRYRLQVNNRHLPRLVN